MLNIYIAFDHHHNNNDNHFIIMAMLLQLYDNYYVKINTY